MCAANPVNCSACFFSFEICATVTTDDAKPETMVFRGMRHYLFGFALEKGLGRFEIILADDGRMRFGNKVFCFFSRVPFLPVGEGIRGKAFLE